MLAIVRFSANKIRRIVDAARSHIPRHFRVGTDGTCAGYHPPCHPGSDDLFWGGALLDPILKRGHQVQRIGPSRGGSATMPTLGNRKGRTNSSVLSGGRRL